MGTAARGYELYLERGGEDGIPPGLTHPGRRINVRKDWKVFLWKGSMPHEIVTTRLGLLKGFLPSMVLRVTWMHARSTA